LMVFEDGSLDQVCIAEPLVGRFDVAPEPLHLPVLLRRG
jgi:hypothetical protein